MSGPFVAYVWAAYGISLFGLALMVVVTLAAYHKAKARAAQDVQDSETKP